MRKLFLSLTILILYSCDNKTRTVSTVVGTGAGGYSGYLIAKEIGNNKYLIPFAIAGSLVGGLIGSEIGENLDSRVASNVLEKNKLNETTKWKNPDTDLTASITPTKTFKNDLNDDCREFEYSYTHKGESSEGKNIACRDINGNWELITPDINFHHFKRII